jgi:hypothetical protein
MYRNGTRDALEMAEEEGGGGRRRRRSLALRGQSNIYHFSHADHEVGHRHGLGGLSQIPDAFPATKLYFTTPQFSFRIPRDFGSSDFRLFSPLF